MGIYWQNTQTALFRKKINMKVKELLQMIEDSKKRYPDLLEWDVAFEQLQSTTSVPKEDILYHNDFAGLWVFAKSSCMGCSTYFKKQKILGLQINY